MKDTNKVSIFNVLSISKIIIFLAVFLVPLVFWPGGIYFYANIKLGIFFGAIIIALILWSISRLKNNDFNFPVNLISLSVLLILITSLLSSVFSSNPFVSIFGSGLSLFSFEGILILFTAFLLIGSLFTGKKAAFIATYGIYTSFVIALFVHLLYVFVSALPNLGFFVSNSVNTIGKWSDLGIVSAFVIIVSYLTIETHQKRARIKTFSWIGLVISVISAIVINETVIWITLGLISLIYLVYKIIITRQNSEESINKSLPYTTIAVLLVSFVMILAGGILSNFSDAFLNINFSETKPGIQSTFELSKNVITENPVFGYGPNRFTEAWQMHKPDFISQTNYWGTDFNFGYSYFTSILPQVGLLGTLAWALFVVMIVWGAIKLLFKKTNGLIENKLNLIHSFAAIFFIFVLFVQVPSASLLVTAFVFLGIFLGSLIRNDLYKTINISIDKKPKIGFLYIFSIIVLMILSIYMAYMSARQFTSTLFLEKASYQVQIGEIDLGGRSLINSINIFTNDQNLRSLSEYNQIQMGLLLQNSTLEDQGTVDSFRGLLTNAINASTAAINYDPNNYLNFASTANIYESLLEINVEGSYEQAIAFYEEALKLNPKNPGIYLDMARTAFKSGQNDVAREYISESLKIKPQFANAAFLLSQIQISEDNIPEAIRSVEASIALQPNNSNLYFQLGLLRYNENDYQGAIASFERAVILSPYFSNAKYFLGLSYEQVGRTSDAIYQFEDLEILNPDNSEIKEILSNLRSGNSIPVEDNSDEEVEDLPLEETDSE